MNIVRTKTGELIHATQIKEDEVYFCPECGEEVTKKVSRNGVVFFSHIPGKNKLHLLYFVWHESILQFSF